MSIFARYIGIDYSGAQTPTASLPGLRVYLVEGDAPPTEVLPPASPKRYWTRRGIAEWLWERLAEDAPTLVGIDHAFSFPLRYFEAHGLAPDWPTFLDDFQRHWPTDEDRMYVDFIREGAAGIGAARMGNPSWRRLTEERAGGAKSVFQFDVPGAVAKSTHAGIPWLRSIRARLGTKVHFWPFDGWAVPAGRSAIAEVYPALWSRSFADEGRTGDQHDAFSIAAWLSRADGDGSLAGLLNPDLSPPERTQAQVEGWILGVPGPIPSGKTRDDSKIAAIARPHPMSARPIRIFLVRHGESEANLDKTVNIRLPDHGIALSPQGHQQAAKAGARSIKRRSSSTAARPSSCASSSSGSSTASPTRTCRRSIRANISTTTNTSASPASSSLRCRSARAAAMSRTGSRACSARSCAMPRPIGPVPCGTSSSSATASPSAASACSGCTTPSNGTRSRRTRRTARCSSSRAGPAAAIATGASSRGSGKRGPRSSTAARTGMWGRALPFCLILFHLFPYRGMTNENTHKR